MSERALAVVEGGAGVAPPDEFGDKRVKLIRDTFAGGAPELEFEMFLAVCRRTGLSPEAKQIYFLKRGNRWTIQTSIDGYRLIADRSGRYAGSDDPVFEGEGRLHGNGRPHPHKATVTVWKFVQGQRCPFAASARWDEYNAGQGVWLTMPHTMLAKCAESLALRKAFPAELSGLYTREEMEQADRPAEPAATPQRTPQRAERAAAPPRPRVEVVDAETGEAFDAPPPAEPSPAPTADLVHLHAAWGKVGVDHARLKTLAEPLYGAGSLKDLSPDAMGEMVQLAPLWGAEEWALAAQMLEAEPSEIGREERMDVVLALGRATTAAELKRIHEGMRENDLLAGPLVELGRRRKAALSGKGAQPPLVDAQDAPPDPDRWTT